MNPLHKAMLSDDQTKSTYDSFQTSVVPRTSQPGEVDRGHSMVIFGGPRVLGAECAALLGMSTTHQQGGNHIVLLALLPII